MTHGIKAKPPPLLWPEADDRNFVHHAQIRNAVGDFFEELTACAAPAVRLKTNGGNWYCPDLQAGPSDYCESKGVGRTNSAIVYECRRMKDLDFMREGNRLTYWVWHHDLDTKLASSHWGLRRLLASSVREVFVMDAGKLHRLLGGMPVRVLNTAYTKKGVRMGYGNKGYGTGWSLPLRVLRKRSERLLGVRGLSAYGLSVGEVDFYQWL